MKTPRLLVGGVLLLACFFLSSCRRDPAMRVVVYCAHDREFAEEIIKDFEKQSGLKVDVTWDTEGNIFISDGNYSSKYPKAEDFVSTGIPFIRANRIKPVAVSTRTRASTLPDIPTVIESGVPAYDVEYWFCVFAPAATPKDIVARLHDEITEVPQ